MGSLPLCMFQRKPLTNYDFAPKVTPSMEALMSFDGKGGGSSVVTASLEAGPDGLCWHPLVYLGVAEQPLLGQFEVTSRHADEYLASFSAGIPGAGGIPIDELGDHSINRDGAFGWGTKLEVREYKVQGKTRRAVSAGIEWTKLGVQVLSERIYKYVSARFTLDKQGDVYQVPNVIKAGALCTRPVFWWQPQVEFVAAHSLSQDELRARRDARSAQWGIEVRGDGRLTPSASYRAFAAKPEDYADPVNLKFPLTDPERLKMAPIFFSQSHSRYSESGKRVVYTRIVRQMQEAGLRHLPNPQLDKLLPPDLRARVGTAQGGAR
jgi:hypothetical protein